MIRRVSIFAFGVASYAIFFATFLYAIGFVGNFGVPRTIDGPLRGIARRGDPDQPGPARPVRGPAQRHGAAGLQALADALRARAGGAQHLRAGVERWRCCCCSGSGSRWAASCGTSRAPRRAAVAYGIFALGWATILFCTFLINHFDLFGLRQVWLALLDRPYTPLRFTTPSLYRVVRHPLYVGWLLAFWATPTMTATHLLFAVATTAYILIAIQLEERDLVRAHGESYLAYRRRVPMLIPSVPRRETPVPAPRTV